MMVHSINIRIFLLVFFGITSLTAIGQSTANNPFSMYGVGEIDRNEYGRSAGMSGTGLAMYQHNTLGTSNPASLTKLDSLKMIFDFSMTGKSSNYSSNSESLNSNSFNYKRLTLGFRCMPGWGTSFGLAPYSNVGYTVNSTQSIEGTLQNSTVEFVGKGGFNKLFWTNSFSIGKYLSVGVNSSFYFGSVAQTQTQENWEIVKNSHASKFYFDFGMQYHHPISENFTLGMGAVYGYKAKMRMANELTFTSGTTVVKDKTQSITNQYLPEFYGAGISLCKSEVLTFAADYRFTGWSSVVTNSKSIKYADAHKVSFGIDYSPNKRNALSYLERMSFQLGASASNSYIKRSGNQPINTGVSCGLGFPLMGGSRINVAYEYGNSGSLQNGMILEKYHQITLNFSLLESWFVHRRLD